MIGFLDLEEELQPQPDAPQTGIEEGQFDELCLPVASLEMATNDSTHSELISDIKKMIKKLEETQIIFKSETETNNETIREMLKKANILLNICDQISPPKRVHYFETFMKEYVQVEHMFKTMCFDDQAHHKDIIAVTHVVALLTRTSLVVRKMLNKRAEASSSQRGHEDGSSVSVGNI
uniref:Uncharacterized protein n=1 Tax=Trichuris muris TaxID=70415 RepID=A0A5S6Q7Z8_TRIMR